MTPPLPRIVTTKELLGMVPYSRQHIARLERKGEFPRRMRVGPRRVGWWLSDVLQWLADRTAESDTMKVDTSARMRG